MVAHVEGDPPDDWQAHLARRLGARPRRLGVWAELALWGVRRCLDDAGLDGLPPQARLQVCSINGPVEPLRRGIAALARDTLPLPFGFLQSQPAVMLAALSAALDWQGEARLLNHRDPALLLRLATARPCAGVLLGWVDVEPALTSRWTWLVPD